MGPNIELFDECRIYLQARDGKKKILIDLAAKKGDIDLPVQYRNGVSEFVQVGFLLLAECQ